MAISGIGILESGGTGTIPTLPKFRYSGNTTQYEIPYPIAPDINSSFKVSATEEGRVNKIIENQLIGISNSMYIGNEGFITFDGVFEEKSNHPENNLIVSISGVEAFVRNVFIGARFEEFAWSGLSHGSTNYLWINPIEESKDKINYRSSRQFRDFETRATITTIPPKEDAILVATFVSGVGINQNPSGKNKLTLVKDHVFDNQNPHGTTLIQRDLVVSGLTVLNPSNWAGAVYSGRGEIITLNPSNISGLYFGNISFINSLTQHMNFTCSGILGNTLSGNLRDTFFRDLTYSGLSLDPAQVGYLDIRSGVANISGSLFRNTMYVVSGMTVDGIDLTTLVPLVAKNSISGNPFKHTHAFNSSTTCAKTVYPKYENSVVDSSTFPGNNFDYGVITDSRNLIVSPTDFGMPLAEVVNLTLSGVWLKCAGGNSTYYGSDVAPDGSANPMMVSFGTGASDGIKQYLSTQAGGTKLLTYSIWAKSISTGNTFRLAYINVTPAMPPDPAYDNFQFSNDFTVTSNWQRFQFLVSTPDTNFGFGLLNSTSPTIHDIEAWGAQVNMGSGATIRLGETYNVWNYNTDLGVLKPTLQHKSRNSSGTSLNPQDHLYLRTWMPPSYNTLDSIEIQNKIDSGNGAIQLLVRDSLGLARIPAIGGSLSSSGVTTTVVSGIPQAGFGQNGPIDLEFTFNNLSGHSHYLGGISFNFKAQRTT